MKRAIYILGFMGILTCASVAMAVPTLQLDITGGWYDPGEETVMIDRTAGEFELIALLTTDNPSLVTDYTYWLSVALVPRVKEEAAGDYGTFTIDDEQFEVTGDMVYGTPPLEDLAAEKDLASHGIFDTYFLEYDFKYSLANTVTTYNVQPGEDEDEDGGEADKITYIYTFDINAAGLYPGANIHFDLYNLELREFAPFSHDAETAVPEPSSLLLLGIGMVGLVVVKRRSKLA